MHRARKTTEMGLAADRERLGSAGVLGLENAIRFWAWAISDDGLRLLLFWPGSSSDSPLGTLRFHLSDQEDAMHVLVTRAAGLPTPRPWEENEGQPLAHSEHQRAEVDLPSALGHRPLVDATEGIARPQVSSGTEFWQRFWVRDVGEAAVREFEQSEKRRWPKARWDYDDDHRIIDFLAPPGGFNESRAVPITAFDRDL